jgi:hypothetical protein
MAQYEYKALQIPHSWLNYYTETYARFGWETDAVQEVVTERNQHHRHEHGARSQPMEAPSFFPQRSTGPG